VSVGIALGAERRDAHDNGERLLEAADAALYEAKHAGRGRWHLATS
jgi:GGDEF domain-containing protein